MRGPSLSSDPTGVGLPRLRRSTLPSGFDLDFSAPATSYTGLVSSLTGSVLLWRGVSTAAWSTGGTDACYEDRGDGVGGGVWTFASATSDAPDPVELDAGGGWNLLAVTVTTEGVIAAPDGTLTARKLDDQSAGTQGCIYVFTSSSARWHSVGYRYPASAPTKRAGFGRTNLVATTAGLLPAKADEAWHRSSVFYRAGTPSDQVCLVVAGYNDDASAAVAGTGAMLFSGAASYAGVYDLPCIDGTGEATQQLTEDEAASTVVGGAFDFEAHFIPSAYQWQLQADARIFAAETPDGDLSVRWDLSDKKLVFAVRGVDEFTSALNTAAQFSTAQQVHRVRGHFSPGTGKGLLRSCVNGAWSGDEAFVATGDPLAAPTALWLGSLDGTSEHLNARWTRARRPATLTDEPIEIAIIGDSLMGCTTTAVSVESTASHIYTQAEALARPGIGVVAVSGHNIAQQKAAWLAAPASWRTAGAHVVRVGINDVLAETPSVTIIAALQDLVDTIAASSGGAAIVLCELLPARAAMSAASYVIWQAVNLAIRTTITGADVVVLSASGGNGLNDGSDNLAPAYEMADHLHHDSQGRIIDARAADIGGFPVSLRGGLVAVGALP